MERRRGVAFVVDMTKQKRAEELCEEHLWFLECMHRFKRAMQRTNEVEGITRGVVASVGGTANDHPLMKRFHKPEDEKRSVVIVLPAEYEDWLACRSTDEARSFLNLFPAEEMAGKRTHCRRGNR